MKVLLAVDDSKSSEAAAKMIIQQIRPDQNEVLVLHAVEPLLIVRYEYIGDVSTLEAAQN
jgi:hypothetical protein